MALVILATIRVAMFASTEVVGSDFKILNSSIWLSLLSAAFTLSIFLLQITEWDHITNQFAFTNADTKLFLCYMMIGGAWSTAMFANVGKHNYTMWGYFFGYVAFQSIMVTGFAYYPNVIVITVFSFLSTFMLLGMTLVSMEKMTIAVRSASASATDTVVASLTLIVGLVAGTFIIMMEFFYYLNRDVIYWAIINSSAVPGILGVTAAILMWVHSCKAT